MPTLIPIELEASQTAQEAEAAWQAALAGASGNATPEAVAVTRMVFLRGFWSGAAYAMAEVAIAGMEAVERIELAKAKGQPLG